GGVIRCCFLRTTDFLLEIDRPRSFFRDNRLGGHGRKQEWALRRIQLTRNWVVFLIIFRKIDVLPFRFRLSPLFLHSFFEFLCVKDDFLLYFLLMYGFLFLKIKYFHVFVE